MYDVILAARLQVCEHQYVCGYEMNEVEHDAKKEEEQEEQEERNQVNVSGYILLSHSRRISRSKLIQRFCDLTWDRLFFNSRN